MPTELFDVLGHRLSAYAFAVCAALTLLVVLMFGASAKAQTFTTLYNFTGTDGEHPDAGIVEDKAGNLYGTTLYGGPRYNGVVFRVSSGGTETVLWSFSGSTDGSNPSGPVIRDDNGNLYGTTEGGGTSYNGTVFMINIAGKETVLHSFAGGTSDGCRPQGGLAMDKYGSLYGTTYGCGSNSYGTVFKLSKKGTYTLLYNFTGTDGAYPDASPILDRRGNLYGVTVGGGRAGAGVVYKLTKRRVKVLYAFTGATNGCSPAGRPAMDYAGNLYGTTSGNGCSNNGTVWKVSQKGTETILHTFAGGTTDGCNPYGGVVRDSSGNLYGTAFYCGAYNGGTVWELSGRTLTLLHSFGDSDGLYPNGELLRDSKGVLYGTTHNGGTDDYGTVWSYAP